MGTATELRSALVLADFDLSLVNWTLSGAVRTSLSALSGNNPSKRLRQYIDARDTVATVVPEPSSAWLLWGSVWLATWCRRR